jgi:Legionella pneumophila major outer membrane protein precursor
LLAGHKLGVQFKHHFCNGSTVKVCAGYQFSHYVDAINDVVAIPGSMGVTSADTKAVDASFQGPFLSIELKV